MSRKRTNKDNELIKSVNAHLRDYKVKDENDNLFIWLCDYLLGTNKYEGFNYYKMNKVVIDGVSHDVVVLAGSYNPDEFDFLQVC